MLRTLLLVGTGGFIGSVMRYLIRYYLENDPENTFPWGTLTANVAGCLLIGLIYGLSDKIGLLNAEWRMFLTVGICGGFTTFSTFSLNNFAMLRENDFANLLLNVGSNLFLGILAVYLGVILIRMIS